MNRPTRLTSEVRENLVAYLDGELEEESAQDVDSLLTHNETARHEVEVLARTWELLDLLPATKASSDFTEKTITNIRIDAQPKFTPWLTLAQQKLRQAVPWVASGILVIAAAVVGFLATHEWVPDPSRKMLSELPLIEDYDQYVEVESIQFLKELRASGLFDVGPNGGPAPGANALPAGNSGDRRAN
ncbi:MAG: hypothetical protein C0478_04445 [Planctomyces sp.]|jgi:hypothetical protein|nr:hypothetical protein [Planctomyces sp.]